jgi:5'-nucleotidase/UDP-sugar diphosphatase
MRVVLIAVALAGCAAAPPIIQPISQPINQQINQPIHVTILHTNDHHGRFWKDQDGEYGLAARKTLIDRIRAEVRANGGYTLLLDAGDVNTGMPESDLQNAEPDFKGMSLAGYDAMAVGNHEFDKALSVLKRQQTEWSSFPWLSANIYQDGRRMFEPYRIFQLGPLHIAVMGLTTDDTAKMVSRDKFPDVSFHSPIAEAQQLLPTLRQQADVVIATTHMGHYPDGKHGVNAPGDVELARAVNGIDLVVGGHSHNTVCMLQENIRNEAYEPGGPCAPDRQNGAWIVQAGEWGKFVGRADFDYRAGAFTLVRYTLIPVNLTKNADGSPTERPAAERIPENSEMLKLLQPFEDRGSAGMAVTVGHSDGKFNGDRASVRSRPTNLGTLITSAIMDKTHADLALVSAGGIRDSLPAGRLTLGDILKAQPFGNEIVVVSLSGAELDAYLRAAAKMTPGSGAFPQLSGVRMTIESGTVTQLLLNGRPIEPGNTYRIATTSFTARGGDGYPVLSTLAGFVNTGLIDADVLREFIGKRDMLHVDEFDPADNIVRR